jgi:hypothetical protein
MVLEFIKRVGYTTRYEEFQRWIHEDLCVPPAGESIKEWASKDDKGVNNHYAVFIRY